MEFLILVLILVGVVNLILLIGVAGSISKLIEMLERDAKSSDGWNDVMRQNVKNTEPTPSWPEVNWSKKNWDGLPEEIND